MLHWFPVLFCAARNIHSEDTRHKRLLMKFPSYTFWGPSSMQACMHGIAIRVFIHAAPDGQNSIECRERRYHKIWCVLSVIKCLHRCCLFHCRSANLNSLSENQALLEQQRKHTMQTKILRLETLGQQIKEVTHVNDLRSVSLCLAMPKSCRATSATRHHVAACLKRPISLWKGCSKNSASAPNSSRLTEKGRRAGTTARDVFGKLQHPQTNFQGHEIQWRTKVFKVGPGIRLHCFITRRLCMPWRLVCEWVLSLSEFSARLKSYKKCWKMWNKTIRQLTTPWKPMVTLWCTWKKQLARFPRSWFPSNCPRRKTGDWLFDSNSVTLRNCVSGSRLDIHKNGVFVRMFVSQTEFDLLELTDDHFHFRHAVIRVETRFTSWTWSRGSWNDWRRRLGRQKKTRRSRLNSKLRSFRLVVRCNCRLGESFVEPASGCWFGANNQSAALLGNIADKLVRCAAGIFAETSGTREHPGETGAERRRAERVRHRGARWGSPDSRRNQAAGWRNHCSKNETEKEEAVNQKEII